MGAVINIVLFYCMAFGLLFVIDQSTDLSGTPVTTFVNVSNASGTMTFGLNSTTANTFNTNASSISASQTFTVVPYQDVVTTFLFKIFNFIETPFHLMSALGFSWQGQLLFAMPLVVIFILTLAFAWFRLTGA